MRRGPARRPLTAALLTLLHRVYWIRYAWAAQASLCQKHRLAPKESAKVSSETFFFHRLLDWHLLVRKADSNTHTPTPTKHVSPKRTALRLHIQNILPRKEPGLIPDDIYEELVEEPYPEIDGLNTDTIKMHIRAVLKTMNTSREVSRESARGRNGGSSFRYIRSQALRPTFFPLHMHPCRSCPCRRALSLAINLDRMAVDHQCGSPKGAGCLGSRIMTATTIGPI